MRCRNCGEIMSCETTDEKSKVVIDWLNMLLEGVDSLDPDIKKAMIKGCSASHYNAIDMEEVLDGYIGDIYGFIRFLESEWNWSVKINEEERVICADENKPYCVCPVVKYGDIKNPLICSCSEGIAEKMFSKVLRKKTYAKVINSVLKGDKSCIYEIRWDL